MDWKLNLKTTGPKPKYRQLMEVVTGAVASGRLKPGDRIPSVAERANRLSVNKTTVVRAFRELERQKLIVAQVGRGSFVAARALVGEVKHAESVERLRELLRTEGGEVIFTTIENVRRALRRKGLKAKDLEPFLAEVMEQAEALYADWPSAA